MPNRGQTIDNLKRSIEDRIEAIDVRLTETERLLADQLAAAEPAPPPLRPVDKPRRSRKKS